MSPPHLIKLIIQVIQILLILILQPVNSLKQLNLRLSLNQEYLILQPTNMLLQSILKLLIVRHEPPICGDYELQL